ncbi:hypothetical protein IGI04_007591 [Brassica rapa subsp. trilocularis]|uniref:Uncharacterized protein n=1 Tax=Brassica rapa subsp. trilocularis TaxID=1813537 RepID=A0ABQ7NK53_BRACM|nr:hypothetical protein IGI04_007591 [Brassica rapa subsp. trilocularis]
MHFMVEDFPRSLQVVSQSLLPKVTLEKFLEDSRKTSCEVFRSFMPKVKNLGRLLKDFLLMNLLLEDFPPSLQEVFQSLLPKMVQRNDVNWSPPSLSLLKNDI